MSQSVRHNYISSFGLTVERWSRLLGVGAATILLLSLPSAAQDAASETPFVLLKGHLIVVRPWAKGLDLNLMIDTGASQSVFNKKVVRKLGLKPFPKAYKVHAFGKNYTAQRVALHAVRIGPIVTSLVGFVSELPSWWEIDAIVGLDLLRNYDFTIDYRSKVIRFGPRTHFESFLHFENHSKELIVPVRVQDTDLRLVVDTGAPTIILSRPRIRNRIKRLAVLTSIPVSDVAGVSMHRKVRLSSFQLGSSKWNKVCALVAESTGTEKDGLDGVLGFHWLKLARIHFDFQNNILSWEK